MGNISDLMNKLTKIASSQGIEGRKAGSVTFDFKDSTEKTLQYKNPEEFHQVIKDVVWPAIRDRTASAIDIKSDELVVNKSESETDSAYPSAVYTVNGVLVHLARPH